MKWLNCTKIRLVLIAVVVAIVLSGGSAYADFTFSTPIELGPPIWYAGHDPQGCCFSRDGLELYFSSNRPGGYGRMDIWVAKRETLNSPWQEPVNLGPAVNSSEGEVEPAISPNGLELYFGLWTDSVIRICSRPSKDAPWSSPVLLGPPVGEYGAYCPEVSVDGLSLYFAYNRPGGYGGHDLWVSKRATTEDDWGIPINLGPNVNSDSYDAYPSISSDGLALFFTSNRAGGYSGGDIWVTTRSTTDDEWRTPVNYPELNEFRGLDFDPAISPDGLVLYFESGYAMWQSSITTIVDFNGDGIVDNADMCIMVDHWGENYSMCDIGPMPWGDLVVDVEDLKVMVEHLFEEVVDPTLIAHWPLDEAQGSIAYNSVSMCDGVLIGDPLWQPDGGMVGGALRFDGIDDCVSTNPVLNVSCGPFSVCTWIKGGAPGQSILSQAYGGNPSWLCIDSAEGCLMTELKGRGRFGDSLLSQTRITDGNWHRIGFVWDGSYRHLHVDGVEVARDDAPLANLAGAGGGLYLGVASTFAPGTFFSGLIDDVRIYNRAVKP